MRAPSQLEVGRASIQLELHVYDLPDDRRAEDYVLRGNWQPREDHQLSIQLHYVGVEAEQRLIYAGGPLGLQWSAALPGLLGLDWGSDVSAQLPVGDGDFHPLSAKATSIEWNLRAGLAREAGRGVWLGWWMRRVSQPTDRVDPQSFFPSGSGAMAQASWSLGSATLRAVARKDFGGSSDAAWLGAEFDYRLADELSLGAGVAAPTAGESPERRLFNRSWTLFFRWNPGTLPDP